MALAVGQYAVCQHASLPVWGSSASGWWDDGMMKWWNDEMIGWLDAWMLGWVDDWWVVRPWARTFWPFFGFYSSLTLWSSPSPTVWRSYSLTLSDGSLANSTDSTDSTNSTNSTNSRLDRASSSIRIRKLNSHCWQQWWQYSSFGYVRILLWCGYDVVMMLLWYCYDIVRILLWYC